jgi:hypothetical protein
MPARKLHRFRQLIGGVRDIEDPDVRVALEIQIALIVAAIDSTADDMHVGFMLALRLSVTGFASTLLALRFIDILRCSGADERNPLPVGRPGRI